MPPSELIAILAVAALLVIALFAVRRRRNDLPYSDAPRVPESEPVKPPTSVQPPVQRPYAPPEGSVMVAQLEVGQTIHVQTETARYSLTLVDPADGLYDAVRVGRTYDGQTAKQRFRMLFFGSFVPNHRLMYGWFVIGGRLGYHKCGKNGECKGPITSMAIQRVIFSIPLKQAS